MDAGFDSAELGFSDLGDFFERELLDKVQQQHRTLTQGQLGDQIQKGFLLFFVDEEITGGVIIFEGSADLLVKKFSFTTLFAPDLDTFLVGDAEKPGAEFAVVSQAVEVAQGADKGF